MIRCFPLLLIASAALLSGQDRPPLERRQEPAGPTKLITLLMGERFKGEKVGSKSFQVDTSGYTEMRIVFKAHATPGIKAGKGASVLTVGHPLVRKDSASIDSLHLFSRKLKPDEIGAMELVSEVKLCGRSPTVDVVFQDFEECEMNVSLEVFLLR